MILGLLLLFATRYFAATTYPLIPANLGGGYPVTVRLRFDSDKIDESSFNLFEKTRENQNCIYNESNSKTCQTGELLMVDELADSHIVLAKNDRVCLNTNNEYYNNNSFSDFIDKYYRAETIKKNLIQSLVNSPTKFLPTCTAEKKNKTVLRFNAEYKYENGDSEIKKLNLGIHIFHRKEEDNISFLMNIYNNSSQIVDLKEVTIRKTDGNNGSQIYTYDTNNHNLTLYDKVTVEYNTNADDKEKIALKIATVDFKSDNLIGDIYSRDGGNIKISNILVGNNGNSSNDNISITLKDSIDEANILRFPNSDKPPLKKIKIIKPSWWNLWRKIRLWLKIEGVFLEVRNQILDLNEDVWYEVFYQPNEYEPVYKTGWIKGNLVKPISRV